MGVNISRRARRLVEKLNEQYSHCELRDTFMPCALDALMELERTDEVPGACIESLSHIIDALVARSSGVLKSNHGGQYLLHLWGRSSSLNRLLGGPLHVDARFALIELATLVCMKQSWIGPPPPMFPPLQEPWWMLLNAIIGFEIASDERTQRWQDIIAHLRRAPVEGAAQNLACALAWCGMVDVERDELIDDDFAYAARRERRWFTVSRGFGLRLLGQLFLFWEGVIAQPRAQRGAS